MTGLHTPRGEVYFLSHGVSSKVRIRLKPQGPPNMYETEGEPYKAWIKFGKLFRAADARGIVVVSAHWEADAGPGVIGQFLPRLKAQQTRLIRTTYLWAS